ncbi:MAG: hybrid sensor histidine kinase/response regulator transcription factor [Firmicutes bacterium]|nr:hybrid sensor histidine kinase/response regulator transcription factor [Bacillota bacterium]
MPGYDARRETDYRVIRAQEEERKRLARDLHDGLLQSLVSIGVSLEVLERRLEDGPSRQPETLELLVRLREALAGCLEEARRIMSDLRPLDLGGRSLSRAIKEYAERVSQEAGLRVVVVISGQESRLHPSLEAGLFRIIQEALSNVREHAEAREVSLKLRFLPRSVTVEVADDGKGFAWNGDFRELHGRRCYGLVGIDERVRLLGGTWRLASSPGHGTELRVKLPVEGRGGLWTFLSRRAGETEGRAHEQRVTVKTEEVPSRPGSQRSGRASTPVPIRLVLADDHRLVREGLRMVFDLVSGIEVVGEADTGDRAIRLCRELTPDVLLLDVFMPGPGGAEVTRRVRELCPRTAVVALTAYHDAALVHELVSAGAAGYLLKTAELEEVVGAVRAAASGLRPLADEAVRALAGAPAGFKADPAPGAPPGFEELTLREREVLALVGEGLTNREIARRLFISEKTVRNHLGAVIRKLGLSDRTQVALAARGLGSGTRGEGSVRGR